MGNGNGRAEDSFEIVVTGWDLVVRLSRGGLCGCRDRQVISGGLDAKLGLSLGSTVELFINGDVVAVQADVGVGAVGIAFEDDVNIRRNSEKRAKLNSSICISHEPQ